MRLVTYLPAGSPATGTSYELRGFGRAAGMIDVDGRAVLVDLQRAGSMRRLELPRSVRELVEAGPVVWRDAAVVLAEAASDRAIAGAALPDLRPGAHPTTELPWAVAADEVRLLAPLPDPPSLRDFFAFEDHVRRGFARRGEDVPAAWFDLPVYYLTNHRSILGPDEVIPWPPFTDELDYELELAMVVGRGGRGLTAEQAVGHIFGFTLYNDCSARDLQRREMQVRLGPARSKGFAQVLGPCIVTADELDVADLHVTARIDGEVVTDTSTRDMRWSFAEMIAYVSEGEDVHPGDVYGSGTVSGGCGLEHGRMLCPGETLELEATGIGVLRNRIGAPPDGDQESSRSSSRSTESTSTS